MAMVPAALIWIVTDRCAADGWVQAASHTYGDKPYKVVQPHDPEVALDGGAGLDPWAAQPAPAAPAPVSKAAAGAMVGLMEVIGAITIDYGHRLRPWGTFHPGAGERRGGHIAFSPRADGLPAAGSTKT